MQERSSGWVIGRIAGAPVIMEPMWAAVSIGLALLFGWSVSGGVLSIEGCVAGLLLVIVTLASVVAHEAGHALVAKREGVTVASISVSMWSGRTSLDTSVTPAANARIAVAGPLVNGAIASVAFALVPVVTDAWYMSTVVGGAALWNAALAVMNLLPGVPMDGGVLVETLVWARTGDQDRGIAVAARSSQVTACVVLIAAVVVERMIDASMDVMLSIGFAAGLLSMLLWFGGSNAVVSLRRRRAMRNLRLGELARSAVCVPMGVSLAEAIRLRGSDDAEIVVVDHDGQVLGYVDNVAAASVPVPLCAHTPVDSVVVPLSSRAEVDASLAGQEALRALADVARISAVVVARGSDGGIVGLLRFADVVKTIRQGS